MFDRPRCVVNNDKEEIQEILEIRLIRFLKPWIWDQCQFRVPALHQPDNHFRIREALLLGPGPIYPLSGFPLRPRRDLYNDKGSKGQEQVCESRGGLHNFFFCRCFSWVVERPTLWKRDQEHHWANCIVLSLAVWSLRVPKGSFNTAMVIGLLFLIDAVI